MRATTPSQTSRLASEPPARPKVRRGDYLVPPILVNDISTQCAAHFLLWFTCHPLDHVRDVLKCGVHKSGGLIEEIEYWMQQCASDASSPDNNLDYWDQARNGPWIYEGHLAVNVARAVKRHTRAWVPKDFASYGYTVGEGAEVEAMLAGFK